MFTFTKQIGLAAVIALGVASSAQAHTPQKEASSPKKHACTDGCKKGQHDYKHGEKGHQCSAQCRAA